MLSVKWQHASLTYWIYVKLARLRSSRRGAMLQASALRRTPQQAATNQCIMICNSAADRCLRAAWCSARYQTI
jgi:hypothetical protein